MDTAKTPLTNNDKVNLAEYVALNHSLLGLCFAKGVNGPQQCLGNTAQERERFRRVSPISPSLRLPRHREDRGVGTPRLFCFRHNSHGGCVHVGGREVPGRRLVREPVGHRRLDYGGHAGFLCVQVRGRLPFGHEVSDGGAACHRPSSAMPPGHSRLLPAHIPKPRCAPSCL